MPYAIPKTTNCRKWFVCTLFICLLGGCKTTSNQIRFGWIGPLTGDAAPYGIAIKNGTEMAVRKINAQGGIHSKSLLVVYEDDQATARLGTAAMQKLLAVDKPPVIIQAAASSVMVANIPTAEANRIVYISPSCSSDRIREEKVRLKTRYIFRTWPSDSFQGTFLARFVYNDLHHKEASILFINNDYGAGLKSVFADAFTTAGGTILSEESFAQDANDFRTQLTKLKQKNPPVILLASHYKEAAQILRQSRQLGLKAKYVADAALFSPEILRLAGPASNGLILTNPDWDPKSDRPAVKQFVEEYSSTYGLIPDVYAASGYDLIFLLAEVMKTVGESPEDIRSGLAKTRGFDGVTGTISFDEIGEVHALYRIYEVRNGTFKLYQ